MKTVYKPYRLITAKELGYFLDLFTEKMNAFNEKFLLEKMNVSATGLLDEQRSDDLLLLKQNTQPIALVEKSYLTLLKVNIFADISSCFNPICEEIFIQLMHQFFSAHSLELVVNTLPIEEWFYKGSPTFKLCLNNEGGQFILYPHPNWVLAHRPSDSKPAKSMKTISEAIASENLSLSIQLEPQRLRLSTLSGLRRGMVIKTDHPLCKPLLMHHKEKSVCQVELGQTGHYKSIRLKRSL